ncbi:Tim44 domain-containing protein [Loktanella sp. D2R18]|uniref:Tim44/TimA family putative adaptor protein n=1 Tax=Rhodobacterales TaxID=204455 RepID=UPI000DEAAE32|nr:MULTISPECIES: Tim44/TimA family putative adaptor protein [Rhodobacterales]MDO6590468.1 Tim44/TimA family putative adaptor protein [Yoonia sp. 1_MG-2023]RBW41188.1 Tim44 domain-containing protein [Loktanella sp. D2R18]
MNSFVELLVLAGIAVFLILRLRGVLGTREGFEKPVAREPQEDRRKKPNLEIVRDGPDWDINDHVAEGSDAAIALAAMKRVDPTFNVSEFLTGARGAYEMILMAFEKGDLNEIKAFISDEVYEAFAFVVEDRKAKGLTVDATFIGVSDMALVDAEFDDASKEAEISVRFKSEMTSVVRDIGGDIVEGSDKEIKRQKDTWTFSHHMDAGDPNWKLVATGE